MATWRSPVSTSHTGPSEIDGGLLTTHAIAPIQITYDATQPLAFQFGSVAGTTFNRKVFLRLPAAKTGASGSFTLTTRVLLHEMEHVVQYQSRAWNVPAFGLSYLYGWCKSGASYAKIPEEAQAYQWEVGFDFSTCTGNRID